MNTRFVSALFVLVCLVFMLPVFAQDETGFLVGVGGNDDIETFLVGPDGMTLYMFALDDATCVDNCLVNWPPLTVEAADDLTQDPMLAGTLGTFEREDGTLQVTYNGMPLYYFNRDEAPGDTNGEGINGVWYVVEPTTVSVGRGHAVLGSFLVGPDGYTLYLFTPDDAECVGACLQNWPPLTVGSEDEITFSHRLPGEIGVFEREDGTLQVAYNGIPLYYFINDVAVGDANGQGVNDVWYVIQSIGTRSSDEFGDYLIGPDGFALYLFTPDDATCVDACLQNWPPLTVPVDTAIVLESGLTGELGFFERDGGMLQVTYAGVPLYYFIGDADIADINGQGVNGVWYLVSPDGEMIDTS